MCGATRENTSSRWTVHWTTDPFFNQTLHLVVKAGKSWKPVSRIFPGQMCKNTDSSPPGSTFLYRKNKEVCTSFMLNTKLLQVRPLFPPFGVMHTETTAWRCFQMFPILPATCYNTALLLQQQQWPFLTTRQRVKHLNLPVWCNSSRKELCKSQVSAETFSGAVEHTGADGGKARLPGLPCK